MIDAATPAANFLSLSSNGAQLARAENAAKDFEAVFIAQMLAPLFNSISTPEIAGGGKSEEFFKSLLQESYAKAMAERGGFGVADHVKSALISIQSVNQENGR